MRRDGRLPGDQAEVVFTEPFIVQLGELTQDEQANVLAEVVDLCAAPGGKHPLSTPLVGWNTLDVLGGHKRVVYKASDVDGTGLIEVLCLGPRAQAEVYDMANALVDAGVLQPDEITELWDSLAVLKVVAEDVGLDGWDYQPPPAPAGMVRAAVAAGVLDAETAAALSKPELEAAMEDGWGPDGPDPVAAVVAALERGRKQGRPKGAVDVNSVLGDRRKPRCGADMPRARSRCVRRENHPGPHRSR